MPREDNNSETRRICEGRKLGAIVLVARDDLIKRNDDRREDSAAQDAMILHAALLTTERAAVQHV